jgi:hypothetical protein
LPDDVSIKFEHMDQDDLGSTKTTYQRVPLDGCVSLLHGKRDPKGPIPMLPNFTKPLPTAWSSLQYGDPVAAIDDYRKRRAAATAAQNLLQGRMAAPELAMGYMWDKYDLDYMAADEQMRRLGHPGIYTSSITRVWVCACVFTVA